MVGVRATWRPLRGAHPETGEKTIIGWELVNRAEVEAAALDWRRRRRPADSPADFVASLGTIGEGGENGSG